MKIQDVLGRLQQEFPKEISSAQVLRTGSGKIVIPREGLVRICRRLKDEMAFDHLSLVSAVDWKDHWESVYHLVNYADGLVLQINARIPREDPRIDSLCALWKAANYPEREAYDMMGIVYAGHPDLRRILMPKDFEYFPLRKDYVGYK